MRTFHIKNLLNDKVCQIYGFIYIRSIIFVINSIYLIDLSDKMGSLEFWLNCHKGWKKKNVFSFFYNFPKWYLLYISHVEEQSWVLQKNCIKFYFWPFINFVKIHPLLCCFCMTLWPGSYIYESFYKNGIFALQGI